MNIPFLKHHLIRQCGGAAMGAAIALLLYGAYEWSAPRAASLLTATGETGGRMELVVERAKALLEEGERL